MSIAATDRINFLNIGLMLVACVVALYIPFELFLFADAVLGPSHYLTEISWLQKRGFFTRGEYDYWILGGLATLLFLSAPWSTRNYNEQGSFGAATFTFLARGSALVLVLADRIVPRILGLAAVAGLAFLVVNTSAFLVV